MNTWNLAPRSVNLQGVQFIDAAVGWVVGDGGLILGTRDGGSTWSAPGTTAIDLRAVAVGDARRAWAVGRDGSILATDDAGSTWAALASDTEKNLYGVSIAPGTAAWAVGPGVQPMRAARA